MSERRLAYGKCPVHDVELLSGGCLVCAVESHDDLEEHRMTDQTPPVSRTEKLEGHIADGRKVVEDLVRRLDGSPGIDVMRGFSIQEARKWLDDTRWVAR